MAFSPNLEVHACGGDATKAGGVCHQLREAIEWLSLGEECIRGRLDVVYLCEWEARGTGGRWDREINAHYDFKVVNSLKCCEAGYAGFAFRTDVLPKTYCKLAKLAFPLALFFKGSISTTIKRYLPQMTLTIKRGPLVIWGFQVCRCRHVHVRSQSAKFVLAHVSQNPRPAKGWDSIRGTARSNSFSKDFG